jgi:hypothetical protein
MTNKQSRSSKAVHRDSAVTVTVSLLLSGFYTNFLLSDFSRLLSNAKICGFSAALLKFSFYLCYFIRRLITPPFSRFYFTNGRNIFVHFLYSCDILF